MLPPSPPIRYIPVLTTEDGVEGGAQTGTVYIVDASPYYSSQ